MQNQQYDNNNRVSLWLADPALNMQLQQLLLQAVKKNAAAPDIKGGVNINGQDFQVSVWFNQKLSGPKAPALIGAVEPKQGGAQQQYARPQYAPVQPQQLMAAPQVQPQQFAQAPAPVQQPAAQPSAGHAAIANGGDEIPW